ncbi:MAG TPA: hypothetical protein PLI61_00305, partial [bacterium]|nr:hypothetical protein [bacterium]
MKKFFSVILITIFFVACSSGKSSINDEDIATGETKDENQQLPTSDDEPGEVEDDMSDDLSDDMSDEALAES